MTRRHEPGDSRSLRRSLVGVAAAVALAAATPGAAAGVVPPFEVSDALPGWDPCGLMARDVTGDRRPDLVGGDFFAADLVTFPARGRGRFRRARRSAERSGWYGCLQGLVDLDRDGRADAVGIQGWIDDTDGDGPRHVWVAFGTSQGRFTARTLLGPPAPFANPALAVSDVNGDRRPDLVALESPEPTAMGTSTGVRLYENLGGRRFRSRMAVGENGGPLRDLPGTTELVVGDLDGDGAQDMLTAGGAGSDAAGAVLLAAGPGRFRWLPLPALQGSPWHVRLEDLDEDGKLDLMAIVGGAVQLATGDGAGGFSPFRRVTAAAFDAYWITDIDADGHLDLVVSVDTGLAVYTGDGRGHLRRRRALHGTRGMRGPLVFADFDRDRRVDVAGEWNPRGVCRKNGGCSEFRILLATGPRPRVASATRRSSARTAEPAEPRIARPRRDPGSA